MANKDFKQIDLGEIKAMVGKTVKIDADMFIGSHKLIDAEITDVDEQYVYLLYRYSEDCSLMSGHMSYACFNRILRLAKR